MRKSFITVSAITAGLLWAGEDHGAAQEVPPIVFVGRSGTGSVRQPNQGDIAWRASSSFLSVRAPEGSVRTILASDAGPRGPGDIQDPDVSYDAKRILFSGYVPEEKAYRIFEVGADGRDLRQITRSDRSIDLSRHGPLAERFAVYDDLDPCYLPDGRICFVSTRYPELVTEARRRATNLYLVNADGSGVHRITTERYGADTPAVNPVSGRIVYSRWWRTPGRATTVATPAPPPQPVYYGGNAGNAAPGTNDVRGGSQDDPLAQNGGDILGGITDSSFSGFNLWSLAEINPDGTGLTMFSGFHLDREATHAYRPSLYPDGSALATFLTNVPVQGVPGLDGLRLLQPGAVLPVAVTGPQTFIHRADLPGMDGSRLLVSSAAALDRERMLLSARDPGNPFNGLYYKRSLRSPPVHLLFDPDGDALDPIPLTPRPVPPQVPAIVSRRLSDEVPVTAGEAYLKNGTFTFLVENIHFNAPVDVPIPGAPPVGRQLFLEFYTSPQRSGDAMTDPPILLHRVEVGLSGRVEVELPAGVPLFEVLRRADGRIAVGRDRQTFHVGGFNFGQPDTVARCVGCHAGHSLMPVPLDASWTNLAPSATVSFAESSSGTGSDARMFVDRSTRKEVLGYDWQPADRPAGVVLSFPGRIRGREVIIYGSGELPPGPDPDRGWMRVISRLGGEVQEDLRVSEIPNPGGRWINLDRSREFDTLEVILSAYRTDPGRTSRYNPGLSEIEVIGQAASSASRISIIRGNTDGDRTVSLSDAVTTLGYLFEGKSPPCTAAADFDADGEVAIDDAISTLWFLFLGGDAPASPFPNCGMVPEGPLGCEQEACP